MKKVWLMLAMLVCIFASCSDGGSDNPVDPTPKPEEVKTEITIDSGIVSNGLSFGVTEGEQSVSFSVNANWTLSVASTTSGATWCKASVTSGSKGTANVKFTVEENTGYDDRSVSVTIKAGSVSKTFTITQKGADALLVTTTKYEVAQEGGQIEIEVKTNINYQMEISEDAKSWITEVSSRALTTYKHKLDIAMNENAEKREGEITFKSGDKVETVKVYQAGGAILLLSQNEYTVSDAGDTISVDIKSNVEYGVQMPDVDWITDEASSRGMSSHTLKYVIAANEEYDSRSAEIIFYDKNSDLKDTLTVVQAQKDAIIVAKNEYTIDAVGGDLKFEVNTNVDFEVSASVDWIKQNTESRALEAKPLNFTIAENTADEAREGLITISSGELKQEIKVLQKAKTVFSLSETEFNVASEGGEIKVEVSTNGEYTITMPEVDWLKENESRATSAFIHTYIVSANETYDAREAEITFTHKETNEVVKVKVVQAQKDAIVISEKNISVAKEGGTIEVKVNTNVDLEVQIPSEATWISQTDSRALAEKNVYLKVVENTSEESRSVEVVFMNKESQISESITISQAGAVKAGYENGVVTIATAGTMKDLLGDDYLNITSLKVVGSINGDDIYYLAKMLGRKDFSEADWGKLTTLDLSDATIVEGGGWYTNRFGEEYTSNNIIGDQMFRQCANMQDIILPNNLDSIGIQAFEGCDALKSIDIPEDVISIGGGSFSSCKALTSISIPASVNSIINAFDGCSSLEDVYITDIAAWCNIDFGNMWAYTPHYGAKMYLNNKLITELIIPEGVKDIKNYAFIGLESITKVIIPNSVTSIGEYAFAECTNLVSIEIPNSVTSMGEYAFRECDALTSVVIGDGIKTIPYQAFSECDSLTTVVLGKSVEDIAGTVFIGCSSITDFYCYATTPPDIKREVYNWGGSIVENSNSTFFSNEVEKAVLYVPARSGSAYKTSNWGKFFKNIIEMD